ncbi:ATP synthase subunit C [Ruminococcaceae bacterium OttesenSCG-928-I18]|nr:ATP synthase subunit C [Ruminococcaceae bacterium OttesenSCG-928-I18]
MKSRKHARLLIFVLTVITLCCLFGVQAFAAEGGETAAAASGDWGFAPGMAYIAAALSTGIAAIGGGMAVGAGAPAAIGALTEDPKSFGKSLIFVALGEGIALYGMLVAILILQKV